MPTIPFGITSGFTSAAMVLLALGLTMPNLSPAEKIAYYEQEGEWLFVDSADFAARNNKATMTENIAGPNGINFRITYLESGSGFTDPALGATRRQTLGQVLLYIDSVVDGDGFLDIDVRQFNTAQSNALAIASPLYIVSPGFQPPLALDHINGFSDPFPDAPDIFVQVNFTHPWNESVAAVQPGQFDLFSVLLHEITHGLGFSSFMQSDGSSSGGSGVYTVFDEQMVKSNSARLIFGSPPVFQGPVSVLSGGNNSLFLSGSNAVTGYAGQRPPLYTPESFARGSSLSHWQEERTLFTGPLLMEPRIAPNVMIRQYSAFEKGLLKDLGYKLIGNIFTPTPTATPTPTPTATIPTPTPQPTIALDPLSGTIRDEVLDRDEHRAENDLNGDGAVDSADLFIALAGLVP